MRKRSSTLALELVIVLPFLVGRCSVALQQGGSAWAG
jgi:hypothetical protein